MKFTVEVDEFWIEEEDLAESIKRHVISEVTRSIKESITLQVQKIVTELTNAMTKEHIQETVASEIKKEIETGEIVVYGKRVPITSHIKEQFEKNNGWNPNSHVADIANKHGKELKARYDLAYATQLLVSLSEQGLLKAEMAALLLEKGK